MIIPDPVQTLPSGSRRTDGRTDVKRACILAPDRSQKHPFAKPRLISFSRLFFLRKVSFVVGDHASVSPHVNVNTNEPISRIVVVRHAPSAVRILPRTVLRITCMKVYGTIRPRAWSLDFPASTNYRSCTQRIFNFNRSSCRPLPVAVADSTGTDADHA